MNPLLMLPELQLQLKYGQGTDPTKIRILEDVAKWWGKSAPQAPAGLMCNWETAAG